MNKPKYIVQLREVGDFMTIETPDGNYICRLREIMIRFGDSPARYRKEVYLEKVENGKHNNPMQKDS